MTSRKSCPKEQGILRLLSADSGMEIFAMDELTYFDEPLALKNFNDANAHAKERGLDLQKEGDMEKHWSKDAGKWSPETRSAAFVFSFHVSLDWGVSAWDFQQKWSASVNSSSRSFAWQFGGINGYVGINHRYDYYGVRCVGGP